MSKKKKPLLPGMRHIHEPYPPEESPRRAGGGATLALWAAICPLVAICWIASILLFVR